MFDCTFPRLVLYLGLFIFLAALVGFWLWLFGVLSSLSPVAWAVAVSLTIIYFARWLYVHFAIPRATPSR